MPTATFGAGCFWGVEETFRTLPGVTATAVGYAGGHVEQPTYEQICTDTTGHVEVVQVDFDAEQISYEKLLEVFYSCHDPTQVNRQGPDFGKQYRTAVFYHDATQQAAAELAKATLDASDKFAKPIATAIEPAAKFWPAEDYHQQYLHKRGQSSCRI
jgi:peptide-methionine (S)-S-oxide reductase